jgi:hypothetical protein
VAKGNETPPDRGITLMITAMRLRAFFTRMAPVTMELIARDCGVADADDRVDALVAYSQTYGLGVIHWRVRYPELAQGASPDANAAALCSNSICATENVMTPTRLRECLDALRWSQRELAATLGCNDRLVRRWTAGAPGYAVPESVGEWLEVLATTHIRYPAPSDWQGSRADMVELPDGEPWQ